MLNIPNAAAFQCNSTSYCSIGAGGGDNYPAGNCQGSYNVYFSSPQGDCYIMGNCRTCKPGYTLVNQDINDNWFTYCDNPSVLPKTQSTCECICDESTKPNSYWYSISNGRQQRENYTCQCTSGAAVWVKSLQYRCDSGHWGTATASGGCSPCPKTGHNGVPPAFEDLVEPTEVLGKSDAGATSITQCYMPMDYIYTDNIGKYEMTAKCYYKN